MNRVDKINFYICNVIVFLGIIFCVLYNYFPIKLRFSMTPCFMHDLIHLYCFGCGGTRAVKALLKWNIIDSILCNPIVVYGMLMFTYYYIGNWIRYVSHPWKKYFRFHKWMTILSICVVIGIFVIRNMLLVIWNIDYLGDLKQFWIK